MSIDRRPFAIALAMTVSACASSGDYPSLAQRPAERVGGLFEPDTPEVIPSPPPAPSADLVARLAQLQRDAASLHAQFNAAAPAATRLAGAAGGTGSDSWASAQVALADLDSLRSRVAVSLAELDALWVDSTVEAGPRDAIGSARDAVEGMVRQEDEVLARLRSRVGS
ncbi:hypothetical protein GCM10011515_16410 [Tsuneonella deserti]|uniref:Uncharacterized protein n=1 Tax=Tsuneonella deserti TaxID=2035528 RepID=A0ABQ1S9Z5_9SPHN|nr:hypothetical protein [Tsuneonella deserti]GGD97353.1 hypothetical protein GCM10011515_16410 [Tsuneonella deserti]